MTDAWGCGTDERGLKMGKGGKRSGVGETTGGTHLKITKKGVTEKPATFPERIKNEKAAGGRKKVGLANNWEKEAGTRRQRGQSLSTKKDDPMTRPKRKKEKTDRWGQDNK